MSSCRSLVPGVHYRRAMLEVLISGLCRLQLQQHHQYNPPHVSHRRMRLRAFQFRSSE